MKKSICLIVVALACLLHGCSSSTNNQSDVDISTIHEDSYKDGYNDGYNDGYESGLNNSYIGNYEEEYQDFKRAIVNLMYDYEYEVVEKMLKFYRKGVEAALEHEFGTKDITVIKDYLEKDRKEQSTTAVGICKYCSETVYAIDATRTCSADTMHSISEDCPLCSYAHKDCLFENDPPKIEKKP